MYDFRKFFIDGAWVSPAGRRELDVINPATEQPVGKILLGTADDVDAAVKAARAAFETFAQTSREERVALLERIISAYKARLKDVAVAISDEMGAPMKLALNAQAASGLGHFMTTLNVLKDFEFEEQVGTTQVRREPVGVCGLITPWNWPINQISCKVAPALAAGCTVVLKPSEIAPLSAHLFAEILAEAGVPKGVFNLVDGDGPTVGEAISRHPDIDMVSFTGSTRAGVLVAKAAAETVKRVSQELGGKSAKWRRAPRQQMLCNPKPNPPGLHSAIELAGRRAFARPASRLSRCAGATHLASNSLCGPLIKSTGRAFATPSLDALARENFCKETRRRALMRVTNRPTSSVRCARCPHNSAFRVAERTRLHRGIFSKKFNRARSASHVQGEFVCRLRKWTVRVFRWRLQSR
jgi:hypothetical protein